jgi:hypothetical protein
MDATFKRKSNEALELEMNVYDRDDNPQSLVGLTQLSLSWSRKSDGAAVVDHDTAGVTVDDAANGLITWRGSRLPAGVYLGAIEALADGKPKAWPEEGNLVLIIEPSPVPSV